ncbi:MAG: TRAP transporter substrate-binding protein DctP [Gammaproteobacteria bacterium]|nr:TRAP transporter substrate-binding protein DctP [Gammaproteobacteria bacterium]
MIGFNRRFALAVIGLLVLGADAGAAELRIATVAPDNSQWMRDMRAGGERISELTEGRVELKFRPGGVMGSDAEVLRNIQRTRQLQGGAFSAGGLASRYNGLNIYSIPLMFRSLEEVDYIRAHLDPKIAARLEEAGFVSLGFSGGGFANLMSKVPVSHVDDLRGLKVWIPDGDAISYQVMDAFNLVPVELPVTDVLTGLQTGTLDVVAAAPVVALVLQWHTRAKYRTELPISFSMGIFAIESRAFYALEPRDQQIVREVIGEVMQKIDRDSRADNEEARELMARYGVEPVAVDGADVEGWRAFIESQYPVLRQRGDIDVELFDEMLSLLDAFRAGRPVPVP